MSPGAAWRAPLVLVWVLWHVVTSALAVTRAALTPGPVGDPVLVRYPLRGRTDLEVTALAWAVTVTPGTLTVAIGEDEMYVHVVLGGPREQMVAELQRTEDAVLWALHGPGGRR